MFGCDKKSKLVDDQMIISFALTICPLVNSPALSPQIIKLTSDG